MSYNGSGTFNINSTGQPVVAGTVISSSSFNSLTNDLATGLTTAITKDGQTTTTARITFAQGITSSLVTDSSSTTTGSIITAGGVGIAKALFVGTTANVASTTDSSSISTGSIITAGGVGIAKNLYVGVNANVAGTLGVTGVATFSAAPIYSSLTASSAVATDASKGLVSVTNTGTGNNVLATSPTLVTPILGTPQSGTLTNATGLPLSTGVTGVLPEANGGTGTTTGYYGFKNRIINGAMVIDQRNAGASVTANSGVFPVDRYQTYATQSSKLTCQQSTTVPANFKNSVLYTSSSAYSVLAGDYFSCAQRIEGFNVADFNFGTANAATVTLSFWVRSSLTGTFGGACHNNAFNRVYPFSYTISAANTWEQKTITIAGDTSGTWTTDSSVGLEIGFSLGCGSTGLGTAGAWAGTADIFGVTGQVNLVGTSGATFYITGVQLEKGSTATSFDYRPYGTELQLCQRYYYIARASQTSTNFAIGRSFSATEGTACFTLPVPMRGTPTGSTPTVSGNFTYSLTVLLPAANYTSNNHVMTMNCTGSFTANGAFAVEAANTNAFIAWSAEL